MIINCTRQDINIITEEGLVSKIKPSGIIPWIEVDREIVCKIEVAQGIVLPLYQEILVSTQNIPERIQGTYYIVSAKVADYMQDREDFIMPNLLKDSTGKPIGITSFRQNKLVEKVYE